MKKRKVYVLGYAVLAAWSSYALGATEPPPSEAFHAWDENSILFETSYFSGPLGQQIPSEVIEESLEPGEVICQLDARKYEFQAESTVVKKSVCENIYRSPVMYFRQLSAEEGKRLIQVLSSSVSQKKDPGSTGIVFQVHQKDGMIRVLGTGRRLAGASKDASAGVKSSSGEPSLIDVLDGFFMGK